MSYRVRNAPSAIVYNTMLRKRRTRSKKARTRAHKKIRRSTRKQRGNGILGNLAGSIPLIGPLISTIL